MIHWENGVEMPWADAAEAVEIGLTIRLADAETIGEQYRIGGARFMVWAMQSAVAGHWANAFDAIEAAQDQIAFARRLDDVSTL